MSGIKIINVLKDDTLADILEVFRQAPAGEVIFVLPKTSTLFRSEDHFAVFSSEASAAKKTITIMSPNQRVNTLARKYNFTVVNASKKKKNSEATLASQPPPGDESIQDTNEDAFQNDVVVPSDESMNVQGLDVVEDTDGEPLEDDVPADVPAESEEPSTEEEPPVAEGVSATLAATGTLDGVRRESRRAVPLPKQAEKAEPVPVQQQNDPLPASPGTQADLDYIDAMWRDKVAKTTTAQPEKSSRSALGIPSFLRSSGAKPSSRTSKRVAVFVLAASVIVLAGVVYATTGSASIVLVPASKALNLEFTIQASDNFSSVDSDFAKLPGQRFAVDRSGSATVAASSERDVASKARGTITVYNTYSTSPQTLITTTRFKSPDGLIFRTLQTVTVPGRTVKGGEVVPGTASVEVVADKPGKEYNIPAGKFVIATFEEQGDTDRVENLYGVSEQPMTGGANGPSKVVTEEDYDKAAAEARAKAEQAFTDALAAQAGGFRVLEEAAIVWDDLTATARPDDAADEVTVTANGTVNTIAFRQEDLDELLTELVMKKERLVVVPEQLDLSFSDVSFDEDASTLTFTVTVNGPGYEPIDVAAVRDDIKGKKSPAIRQYFSDQEALLSATVTLEPFWVRSIPGDDQRIHIDLEYVEETGIPAP